MKTFILSMMLFLSSTILFAEEYQAPKFHFDYEAKEVPKAEVADTDWEPQHKFEQDHEAERSLASDEKKEVARDPSSKPRKRKRRVNKSTPAMKPWLWDRR